MPGWIAHESLIDLGREWTAKPASRSGLAVARLTIVLKPLLDYFCLPNPWLLRCKILGTRLSKAINELL